VVVGKVDPSEVIQLVEKTFGSLRNTESGAAAVLPRPVPPTPLRSRVIVVRGQDYAEVTLFAIPPLAIRIDATKQRESEFAEAVIAQVLGRRLAMYAATENLGATRSQRSDPPDPHFREYSFSIKAAPNQWPSLATYLATEVRRLCTENIPANELEDAVAAQLAAWRAKREEFQRRPANMIADEMVTEIVAGTRCIVPARRFSEAEDYLALLTPTDARIVAQTLFNEEALSLILTVPTTEIEAGALLTAYRQGAP